MRLLSAAALFVVLILAGPLAEASHFLPPVLYPAGNRPNSIVAGDFNSDGLLDLAVTNLLSNDVSILFGNSDGSFQAPVNYPVGLAPTSIGLSFSNTLTSVP